MFGLNLLNPFALGDTIDTSTIVWLRILLLFGIIMSSYVAYITSSKWIQYAMYTTIGLSIFVLLWYLNTGSVFPGLGSSCSHCPSIGSDTKSLKSGMAVSTRVKTPSTDPFTTSHLYYFVIQDTLGTDTGNSEPGDMGSSLIDWKDYYRIGLDRTTGMIYFRPYDQKPSESVNVAKIPYNTLCQITIIQNQKTFAICINGERKATVRSPRLPQSSCLTNSPVINKDGIVNTGMLYHMEIHNTLFDTPDLQRHRESVVAVYSNSSIFQNTPLPSSNANVNVLDRVSGYTRLATNQFSYPKVLDTGLNSLQEQNG
jgi:hypothetical protein